MRKLIALIFLLASSALAQTAPQFDVLVRNGRVFDGSGNPWFRADIGIVGDRITFIGPADEKATAKQVIDAKDLIVAPGFIDMLGQSETTLFVDKRAVSKLTQGITTEITGEGDSVAPTSAAVLAEDKEYYEHYKINPDWRSLEQYFNRLEKLQPGINLGTYVGATQVRKLVIGNDNRPPTADELKKMTDIVDDAMSDGAMGVSSALIYAPANYAKTDELIALAKIASKYGGIYATHMRNEGDTEIDALNETFRIAREANIPVEIFHFKSSGKENWGKMPQMIAAIEKARAEGLDITADQYPYTAAATSLDAIVPPEYKAGGRDAFVVRLQDPKQRAEIRKAVESGENFENWVRGTGGPQGILITDVLQNDLKKYQGKTVADLGKMMNKDPLDAAFDLIVQSHDNTGAVYFSMNEQDVKLAMRQPWVSVDNDASGVSPDGILGESKTHPRAYGTFPRILGKYVRDEKNLTMADAIRKFTSLPAQRMKLRDRGLIKPNYFADITIFNPDTVKDVATYEDSNRPSQGIEYVIVNGVISIDHGKLTGQTGGRPLRGPGYAAAAISESGLEPKGKLRGYVTDGQGWPLLRATLTLMDANGKPVSTMGSKREGKYEIPLDQPCKGCKLRAERAGFTTQERAVDYNGTNTLTFTFALSRVKQ
ncbi:MAG: amidohydrolase family protein [Terriglobales bacterium]